jgi:hypothetical protein
MNVAHKTASVLLLDTDSLNPQPHKVSYSFGPKFAAL